MTRAGRCLLNAVTMWIEHLKQLATKADAPKRNWMKVICLGTSLRVFTALLLSHGKRFSMEPPSKPQEMTEIGWFSYSFDAYLDSRPYRIIVNSTSNNSVTSVNFIFSYNPWYCMISCGNPPKWGGLSDHSTPFQMMVVASNTNLMV